jgi:transcription elongation factor
MAVNNNPFYRWDSGSSLNLETPTWSTSGWDDGDDVESQVAGALCDILDSINDGDDMYTDGDITNSRYAQQTKMAQLASSILSAHVTHLDF